MIQGPVAYIQQPQAFFLDEKANRQGRRRRIYGDFNKISGDYRWETSGESTVG